MEQRRSHATDTPMSISSPRPTPFGILGQAARDEAAPKREPRTRRKRSGDWAKKCTCCGKSERSPETVGHGIGHATCCTRSWRRRYAVERPGSRGRELHGDDASPFQNTVRAACALETGDAVKRSRLGQWQVGPSLIPRVLAGSPSERRKPTVQRHGPGEL